MGFMGHTLGGLRVALRRGPSPGPPVAVAALACPGPSVKAALKHEAMTRKNACAHRLSQRGRKALEQLSVKITSLAAKLRGKVGPLLWPVPRSA